MSLEDRFRVVQFHHIDDPRCLQPLELALEHHEIKEHEKSLEVARLRSKLTALFLRAGWEGDGEIECIFIAPCFLSSGDTFCEIVYHVKQSNNGTSWLAIPKDSSFSLPNLE